MSKPSLRALTMSGGGSAATSPYLGLNAQTITGDANGAWTITANGTNQNVTLTPSGTGRTVSAATLSAPVFELSAATGYGLYTLGGPTLSLCTFSRNLTLVSNGNALFGGLATDGTGVIQLPTATTAAGGITLGETTLFRNAAGQLTLQHTGGTVPSLLFNEGSTQTGFVQTSATTFLCGSLVAGSSTKICSGAGTLALTIDSSQNVTVAKKVIAMNGVSLAGYGVPAIVASARVTGQTAANASIATYTVGASDGTFDVSGIVNVTAATAISGGIYCSYTDETNTSRSAQLLLTKEDGAVYGAFVTTGVWHSLQMTIRAKASTAITVYTSSGTYTGVTYNAEGLIRQVA
jgi:hypothetical protein